MNTRGERWWLLAACVVLFLGFAAAPARGAGEYRTFEVELLRVAIDSEWATRTTPGYLPVRIELTNLDEARVIEIWGQSSRYFKAAHGHGMHMGGTDLQQAVRLARGDRVRLTLPMPIFGDSENFRFEIRENGRTLQSLSYMSLQSGTVPNGAAALIVSDPTSALGAVRATWLRPMSLSGSARGSGAFISGSPGGPVSGMPPLDFVLPPGRLPTNWLGYTSLRAVIIGPAEWEQLSDAQQGALLTWTACGGDLFFVDGDLGALFPGGRHLAGAADDRAPRAYFFGRIHRPTSASVAATGLHGVLTAAVQDPDWALPANGARFWGVMAGRGFRLPIPGIGGVPARAYVSILMVFSLIIGPANYWFLKRRRQQVLLVLTAPLISAMFIVLLAGYVLAGEGLGVRGRAVTFTMLDQVRNQASTRTSASLYAAGMAPSGGLRFPRDVAVFPIGPDGTGSRGRQDLDLSDAQRFAAGVMQARSPTNVEQIAFRTARERLSFSREAGRMTVVNGLGAAVTALSYRDGDTVYTLPRPLPPGRKETLEIGARAVPKVVPADVPVASRFVQLFENQPAGSYLAVLERSPFWEPGVPDVVERGSFHLVMGWPGGQP